MSRKRRKQRAKKRREQGTRVEAAPARSRPGLKAHVLWFLAAGLLSPFVLRAVALAEHPAPLAAIDITGFWADLVVGTAVALLFALATRVWRPVAVVLAAAWVGLNYANYESIHALRSLLNLGFTFYIFDPTFLFGSALSPLRPILFLGLLIGTVALVWLGSRGTARPSPGRATLAAAGLVLLGLPLFVRPEAEFWRQTNVLTGNLRWLVTPGARAAAAGARTVSGDLLEGTRFVGELESEQNVLLILIEGASGAYVAPSAAAQGLSSSVTMPGVSALATRGLNYTSFVAQQVQTNRGEYAALCGDYPKLELASPKMSDAVAADAVLVPCLPAALRDLGYQTVYLQSAPMPFMLKDQFMPLAGFSRSYGADWFRRAYVRDMWGVDDRAFFEQGLDLIEELQARGTPWLLTMLTSGTHHPYRLPKEVIAEAADGSSPFALAVGYADGAVSQFVNTLEARGILENTLVLITSDESNGLHEDVDALTTLLSRNWGPLVVLAPGEPARQVDQPFLQMDLAPSVLDYLGYDWLAATYPGRSIFRSYDEPRKLGFGNVYQRAAFAVTEDGRLIACDDAAAVCLTYRISTPERLFATNGSPSTSSQADRDIVGSLIRQSTSAPRSLSAGRVITLIPPGDVEIAEHSLEGATVLESDGETTLTRLQYVFGGQSLTIPAGARVDVDIDFELVGDPGASAVFRTDLGTLKDLFYVKQTGQIFAGQRMTLGLTFVPDQLWFGVDSRLWTRKLSGNARIRFTRAVLTLTPPGSHQHPQTGSSVDERVFEIR